MSELLWFVALILLFIGLTLGWGEMEAARKDGSLDCTIFVDGETYRGVDSYYIKEDRNTNSIIFNIGNKRVVSSSYTKDCRIKGV